MSCQGIVFSLIPLTNSKFSYKERQRVLLRHCSHPTPSLFLSMVLKLSVLAKFAILSFTYLRTLVKSYLTCLFEAYLIFVTIIFYWYLSLVLVQSQNCQVTVHMILTLQDSQTCAVKSNLHHPPTSQSWFLQYNCFCLVVKLL